MDVTPISSWRLSYQQLTGLLIWIGGVLATIIGSWIASKIRVYHDSKRGHHEDLKTKVLTLSLAKILNAFEMNAMRRGL